MKFHHSVFILLGLLLLLGCNPSPKDSAASDDSSAVKLPAQFYKQLHGNFGDAGPFTLDLIADSSELRGTYYEDATGIVGSLKGKIDTANVIQLEVWKDSDHQFGALRGKFVKAEQLSGSWKGAGSSQELPVVLNALHEGIANLEFVQFHEENCGMRNPKPANLDPAERESWNDTLCPYIAIQAFQVVTGNDDVDAAINAAIASTITDEDSGESLEAYSKSIYDLRTPGFEGHSHYVELTTNSFGVIAVTITTLLDDGEAYPWKEIVHLNFDLQTGKQMQLEDLLKPNSRVALNALGKPEDFVKGPDSPSDSTAFEGFVLPTNFAITTNGLRFTFGMEELHNYLGNMPEIVITYKEMADLILPTGPLARMPRR